MAIENSRTRMVASAQEALGVDPGDEAEESERPEGMERGEPQQAQAAVPSGDAIAILKADHANVKQLFEEVLEDESSTLPGKRPVIDRILAELELHAKLEETLFYPAVKQKSKRDSGDRQQVLEALEEHGAMKDLMRKIKKTAGRDETLRAKVQVLREMVEHHVEEEESELFPEAQRLLGERKLEKLGAEFAKIKQRASRRGTRKASAKKSSAKKSSAKAPALKAKGGRGKRSAA